MAVKVSREDFERAVESEPTKARKIQTIGALLARAIGADVVIVAGSAIEVQTSGRTVSDDIDIVTSAPRDRVIGVVESWGFRPSGRIWRRKDWNIDIDLLGSDLRGQRRKLRRFETPYGPVYATGVEDLIAYRLSEFKHGYGGGPEWKDEVAEHVSILLEEYGDQLDEEYMAFLAKRDRIADVLAEFRRRAGRRADPLDLRRE